MIQIQVCIDICNDSTSTKRFIYLFLKIIACFMAVQILIRLIERFTTYTFHIKVCVVCNGNSISVLDGLKVR